MYGLPLQTFESWKETLKRAVALPIQHISLYGLQLEPDTALERLNLKAPKHYPLPDDGEQLACYAYARNILPQQGFELYEVSNAARTGCESRHNMAYWQQKNYLAFGPGAHGFIHPRRYQVIEDLKAYNQYTALSEITESHTITAWEHLENTLIFGLRMTQGVTWQAVQQACTPETTSFETLHRYVLDVVQRTPYLTADETGLRLLPAGIPQMNTILSHFIQLETEVHAFSGCNN
jgi:oxygen-independent coproporphyrinogen III oxidase